MEVPDANLEIWPVLALRVRTPRVELLPIHGDLVFDVARLAARGIHDPATMPFSIPWTDIGPPEQQRNTVRHYHETWAAFRPESWHLPLAVFEHGALVGVQSVIATENFGVTRSFETGSWIQRDHQGAGIGKEMRAAVLHLMFAGLGAQTAHSGAWVDNPASLAVTRAMGYEPNGRSTKLRRGEPVTMLAARLDRSSWLTRRRDDIEIAGLDRACRTFLGVTD